MHPIIFIGIKALMLIQLFVIEVLTNLCWFANFKSFFPISEARKVHTSVSDFGVKEFYKFYRLLHNEYRLPNVVLFVSWARSAHISLCDCDLCKFHKF